MIKGAATELIRKVDAGCHACAFGSTAHSRLFLDASAHYDCLQNQRATTDQLCEQQAVFASITLTVATLQSFSITAMLQHELILVAPFVSIHTQHTSVIKVLPSESAEALTILIFREPKPKLITV